MLNLLSKNRLTKEYNLKIILSLKPYFKNKSMIQSAVYAGITIIVALLINMLIFHHSNPKSFSITINLEWLGIIKSKQRTIKK